MASILIVMGVSGCGKSTVAIELSKRLKVEFLDGDDVHPESNIRKMSSGIPLSEEDRLPWLLSLREKAVKLVETAHLRNPTGSIELPPPIAVIACSALKCSHRDILRGLHNHHSASTSSVQIKTHLIYLKGSKTLIESRMKARQNHFMGAEMLESQLRTLEEPNPDVENSPNSSIITISIESTDSQQKELSEIIGEIMVKLREEGCLSGSTASNSATTLPPIEKVVGPQAEAKESRTALSLLFEVSESIDRCLIPLLQKIESPCLTYEEVISVCQRIVEVEFDLEDRVSFLGSHPRIGEVKGLSKISANEQQNHKPTDPKVLQELERLNRVYEATYPGLRYVTFVNGRSREEIMHEMQHKLYGDGSLEGTLMVHERDEAWHIEIARGINDVFRIAVSRLRVLQRE